MRYRRRTADPFIRPRNVDVGRVLAIVRRRFLDLGFFGPRDPDDVVVDDELLKPASCARAPATGPPPAYRHSSWPYMPKGRAGRIASAGVAKQRLIGGEIGATNLLQLLDRGSDHLGVGKHPLKFGLAEREVRLGRGRWVSTQATVSCIALPALSVAVFSAAWSAGVPTPFQAIGPSPG